jgi:hypothetical protein
MEMSIHFTVIEGKYYQDDQITENEISMGIGKIGTKC